jgi:hypothetical protein
MRGFAFALAAIALTACGQSETIGDPRTNDASIGGDANLPDASGDGASSDGSPEDAAVDASDGSPGDASSEASPDASTPCYANDDCVGGSCQYSATVCTGKSCVTSSACPGTCVPFVEKGGFCLAGNPPECDPDSGTTCDPFRHQCLPPSGQVLPVVGAGAPCGLGKADCTSGSFCYAPTYPDNGTCVPIAADGGACDPTNATGAGSACTPGLVCAGFGSSLDAGVCRPPSPAGGSCITDTGNGGNSGCATDTLCVDGGCVALPTTGTCLQGQCDPDAGYCDTASGACAQWVPNGGPCTISAQCASHLCASTTNTCVTTLPNGAACSGPYDCTKGLCSTYLGCASGICDLTRHCAPTMCPRDAGH